MSDDEKESVLKELNRLLRKDEIANHLSMPVDQERYCDYTNMIEIPMDMMFIKRRLAANFYGSKLGVASDLRLIRDNCIKYNTTDNEMSETAELMCNEFEENTLSNDERSQMISEEDFDKIQKEQSEGRQLSSMRIRLSARTIQEASQAAASSGGRYTLRGRTPTQGNSSLENLPAPDIGSTQRQRNRREVDGSDVAREVNNSRSRGRNDETEVLGHVTRRRSTRRDLSAMARGVNDFRNTSDLRNSRSQQVRGNRNVGRRRSTRTSNNMTQNGFHSDEVEITTASRSALPRRSSRGTVSRNLRDIQVGEDVESHADLTVATRGSRRSRRPGSTRSPYIEQQDEESEEEEDRANENDLNSEISIAESQFSDPGDNGSISSEGSESVDSSPTTRRSRSSQRTTRTAPLMSASTEGSPARRSSRRTAAKKSASYMEVDSEDAGENLSDSEDSESSELEHGRGSRRNLRAIQPKEESPARRSPRGAAKKRATYEEVESDADEQSDSEDSESSEDNYRGNSGRNRRSSVPFSTEVESDVDVSEDEESLPPKRTAAKRKRGKSPW
jgi:hypothetical protein